jgi:hypothetical protein
MNTFFAARVRQQLVEAAWEGAPRSYGRIADNLGLDRRQRSDLQRVVRALNQIMWQDHQRGLPCAAVAAVNARTRLPGQGFRQAASELLGRFSPGDDYRAFVAAEWQRFRAHCVARPVAVPA